MSGHSTRSYISLPKSKWFHRISFTKYIYPLSKIHCSIYINGSTICDWCTHNFIHHAQPFKRTGNLQVMLVRMKFTTAPFESSGHVETIYWLIISTRKLQGWFGTAITEDIKSTAKCAKLRRTYDSRTAMNVITSSLSGESISKSKSQTKLFFALKRQLTLS